MSDNSETKLVRPLPKPSRFTMEIVKVKNFDHEVTALVEWIDASNRKEQNGVIRFIHWTGNADIQPLVDWLNYACPSGIEF